MFAVPDTFLVQEAVALLALLSLAVGCAYAGWQMLRRRGRTSVVRGRVAVWGRRRALPTAAVPLPPRLKSGAELGRLADVMRAGRGHLEAIVTSQHSAARHLDSAEVALSRLMADVLKVMPATAAPGPLRAQAFALAA